MSNEKTERTGEATETEREIGSAENDGENKNERVRRYKEKRKVVQKES